MSFSLQIALILYSIGILIFLWQFTKRKFFRPGYAILWLLTAFIFTILSIFPKSLILLAQFFGLQDVSTIFLMMGLAFITVLLTHHTVLLSRWSRKSKDLAREIAILRWQIEQLEKTQGQQLKNEEEATKYYELTV